MINGKRVVAIIQARMGSSRFPGKVLKPIYEQTSVLEMLYRRMETALNEGVDAVVVATTTNPLDDAIVTHCTERHMDVFRGSEEDVAGRVLAAAEHCRADIIVDVTADCPLVDPRMAVALARKVANGYDYASNVIERTWPDGFDVQVYATEVYKNRLATAHINQEHSGWNLMISEVKKYGVLAPDKFQHPSWELTVDHPEDLELLRIVLQLMRKNMGELPWEWEFFYFTAEDVMGVLLEHPALLKINQGLRRKAESNPAAERKA